MNIYEDSFLRLLNILHPLPSLPAHHPRTWNSLHDEPSSFRTSIKRIQDKHSDYYGDMTHSQPDSQKRQWELELGAPSIRKHVERRSKVEFDGYYYVLVINKGSVVLLLQPHLYHQVASPSQLVIITIIIMESIGGGNSRRAFEQTKCGWFRWFGIKTSMFLLIRSWGWLAMCRGRINRRSAVLFYLRIKGNLQLRVL